MELLLSLLKISLAGYFGLCLLLFFKQEGMIFLGAGLPSGALEELRRRFPGSELSLRAPDGTQLHGWYLATEGEGPAPLLIYFGGNAEDVSTMLVERQHFPGVSMLLVNYRGYGRSEGEPSQKALISDALFLYDRFSSRPEVDPKRILLMGRSLGSAVAIQLASGREVAGLILISPFESLRALGRELYPWLPTSLLLRHPFDSLSLAPEIRAPMLAIIAGQDSIIPPEQSRRLLRIWGGPARLVEIPGADHNDLGLQREFWRPIEEFVAEVKNIK